MLFSKNGRIIIIFLLGLNEETAKGRGRGMGGEWLDGCEGSEWVGWATFEFEWGNAQRISFFNESS
jgi:hypothetical protein